MSNNRKPRKTRCPGQVRTTAGYFENMIGKTKADLHPNAVLLQVQNHEKPNDD